MVFDNFTEIEIGEKKYKLCLKNKCAFLAERELSTKNILTAIQQQPMSMEDLFIFFKYGLIGGGNRLTEDQAFDLFLDAIAEKEYAEVFQKTLETLMKSGLLGDAKKLVEVTKV